MIEEQARVLSVNDSGVWVETLRKTTCSGCQARQGCGQHLIQTLASEENSIKVFASTSEPLSKGDLVMIGVHEHALLKASVIMYLIPLVALATALFGAKELHLGDGATFFLGITCLLLGFLSAKQVSETAKNHCRVKVVQRLPLRG